MPRRPTKLNSWQEDRFGSAALEFSWNRIHGFSLFDRGTDRDSRAVAGKAPPWFQSCGSTSGLAHILEARVTPSPNVSHTLIDEVIKATEGS